MDTDDQGSQQPMTGADTETLWRSVDAEFGLLTDEELSTLLRAGPDRVRELYSAGYLVAIHRRGHVLYPGFQVERATRTVLPVIGALLRAAERAGASERSLILWLVQHDDALGARPVDLIHDADRVLAAFTGSPGQAGVSTDRTS